MADLHAHRPQGVDRFVAGLDHPARRAELKRLVREIIRRNDVV